MSLTNLDRACWTVTRDEENYEGAPAGRRPWKHIVERSPSELGIAHSRQMLMERYYRKGYNVINIVSIQEASNFI